MTPNWTFFPTLGEFVASEFAFRMIVHYFTWKYPKALGLFHNNVFQKVYAVGLSAWY